MQTLAKDKGLLTIEESALYLGVTVLTFRQNYSNRLEDVKEKLGRRVYFPKSALTRFLKSTNSQN